MLLTRSDIWHGFRRSAGSNVYAVQQDTQYGLNDWVLFSTYVSSTCFGHHRSIFRSVLQVVFADLVCGNTRTTRHVQPLHMLARHVSDLTGPSSGAFYKFYLQIWYVVIRVLLDTSSRYFVHTKSANTTCKTLLKMGRWGPKHVELTYVMNKTQSLKNFVYLVGLHIYYTVPTISS